MQSAREVIKEMLNEKLFTINLPKKEIRERHVKEKVKQIILEVDSTADIFMPVPTGFGKTHLDYLISIKGHSLHIETKIVGKKPTARQSLQIQNSFNARVPVLVIDQENLADVYFVAYQLLKFAPIKAFRIANEARDIYNDRAKVGNYKS